MTRAPANRVAVRPCGAEDADALADLAAATFPLACPPSVPAADIAAFIAEHLSAARFAEYAADPRRLLLAAHHDGRITGYALLVTADGATELSKFYVLPDHYGDGTAATLMQASMTAARDGGATTLRLGVNRSNERAQRFYRKHRFEVTGTRTFTLGSGVQDDYIMSRAL